MKKVLILFVVWMTFQMPTHAAETGTTSGMSEKVYQSMDEEGVVVANVIQGSVFTILSEHTDENGTEWYFICTDTGTEGYIQKEKTLRKAEETGQSKESHNQINVIQNVNIREYPTTDAEIVGRVPSNTILESLQKQENEAGEIWYQISYEGVNGYIRESAVDIIEIEQGNEVETQEQPEQTKNTTATEIQEITIPQEEAEDTPQSVQVVSKENNRVTEKEREQAVVYQKTTRKAVNPIDEVVLFIMLGMVVSLLPVIFIMRRIRKKRHKKADYNRKMRR